MTDPNQAPGTDQAPEPAAPKAGRSGLRVPAVLLVLGAVALWAASRVQWVQARTEDDLRGVREADLLGSTWAAQLTPLALVLLAGVAAVFALRGLAVRVLALVLLVVAVAAAEPAVVALVGGPSAEHAAELITPPVLAQQVSTSASVVGPLLALLGALLTVAAAVLLARAPRRAGGLSTRYETPAVQRERATQAAVTDDDVTERQLWDALSAGQDPTADHGTGTAAQQPAAPMRDVGHHPDRLSEVEQGEQGRGA
ncbi:TIGR02234 family membrane protein [Rhodococcus sp. X156]|uniref:TIGR02234 family membrane protein n=1 Tax=Rhodococcus sp. X156 TaxID=2499145 RepID=UPI000FD85AB2|nr:TIGR02234 family membrane protein [Rhodococcus sp. X156]